MKPSTFTIDSRGNRWVWNCGWYIVDKDGAPLRTRAKRPRHFGVNPTTLVFKSVGGISSTASKQRPDHRQQPLSHAEFRRAIVVLDTSTPKSREVLHGMDKPGRFWRRCTTHTLYEHPLFGNVHLLATDGCHAVVRHTDGSHKYVCFENLTEYHGVPMVARKGESRTTKSREAKTQATTLDLVNKLLNLTKLSG